MKEIILSAVISSIFTAVLGFLAFLFSQIYFKLIERFRELKACTVHALVYYANVFHNPIDLAKSLDGKLPESHEKASDELRKLAADWSALIELKIKPGFYIPSNSILEEVSRNLIGLSNGMTHPYNSIDSSTIEDNIRCENNIRRLLEVYSRRT